MVRLLPCLLLIACALDDRDLDGDGFSGLSDCDDLDATIFPDAAEVLDDGIDQDCDGADLLRRVQGLSHTCDLDTDGRIACRGDNGFGQLEAPDGAAWTTLVAGAFHNCALDDEGQVRCWGDNRFGQADAPDLSGITSLNASEWATTAVADRVLYCWGACKLTKREL